jgi:peptidoglycan/LPS O-acetylase OafA/YrhL
VPLVMTLAIGAGSLPALLSTRWMVYGGQISFCVYMVHELVHTSWTWTAEQFQLTLHGAGGKLIVAGLLTITVVGAIVLFHAVEEPARRWMRRMVHDGPPITDLHTDPTAVPAPGRVQSIDRVLEARPKSVSARAG